MLTEQELKKIRQEAKALYPLPYPELEGSRMNREMEDLQKAHIAAVTAERERAKVLVDALTIISKGPSGLGLKGFMDYARDTMDFSTQIINEYENNQRSETEG